MKRVVTDVNTKLDTLTYSDVSEEAINKNELLIKELLLQIENDEKYISRSDIELLEKYKATQILINELCTELELSSLSQVIPYVDSLKKELSDTLEHVDKQNISLDKKNLNIAKLKESLGNKNNQIKELKAQDKKNKKKISNYKNRKVIRIVDKLVGK